MSPPLTEKTTHIMDTIIENYKQLNTVSTYMYVYLVILFLPNDTLLQASYVTPATSFLPLILCAFMFFGVESLRIERRF